MQFTAIVVTLAAALAGSAHAWTQDASGLWVANDNWYTIRGVRVHESCTRMNDDTIIYRNGEDCALWTDGAGTQYHGHCLYSQGVVYCG